MVSETFQEFFEPLVGSPEASHEFRRVLTQYVQNPADNPKLSGDPYRRLSQGLNEVVDVFIDRQMSLSPSDEPFWRNTAKNIKVGGVALTVSALRATGELYERHARVPQDLANVQGNTKKALGHVLSLAMQDSLAATINTDANRLGWDPRNTKLYPIYIIMNLFSKRSSLARAFTVSEDANGQLSLQVRYRNLPSTSDGRCPATYARTEVQPGRTERSLWRYLQVIGDVAITEIFPMQFAIKPSEPKFST